MAYICVPHVAKGIAASKSIRTFVVFAASSSLTSTFVSHGKRGRWVIIIIIIMRQRPRRRRWRRWRRWRPRWRWWHMMMIMKRLSWSYKPQKNAWKYVAGLIWVVVSSLGVVGLFGAWKVGRWGCKRWQRCLWQRVFRGTRLCLPCERNRNRSFSVVEDPWRRVGGGGFLGH